MATYTTNYNLEKPEATDPFGDFRQSYNDNMDIIDQNLGGGGGGGGHTIVDENGSDMPAESKLQFTGNVSVSDDNVNGATVVDVLGGGGGDVYGAFIDTNKVIQAQTAITTNTSASYTATEDCYVKLWGAALNNTNVYAYIDGVEVARVFESSGSETNILIYWLPLKKGQVFTATTTYSGVPSNYTVYGITQGTNGIYAPVIYSDNERVIGVWRDNKPLYQKTFPITSSITFTQDNWVQTAIDASDIGNIAGCFITNTAGAMLICSAGIISNTVAINSPRQVVINANTGEITLQYTKTTDVAGSGNWNTDGVPTHHYSTSEQVIGTYFGKPLYEKTWDNVSIGINGNDWVYFNDPVDIDNVISFAAYWNNSDRYLRCAISEYQSSNSNGIMFAGFNGMNRTVNRITAQYTKTTDT